MFKLEFDTDNAAFEDGREAECARILRRIAERLEAGATYGRAMDANGNKCGEWELTEA